MIKLAVDNGASVAVRDQRRQMLAKVHVARGKLGIAEDDYRAIVERVTGKRSAGDCDRRELDALLREFGRLGFAASAPRSARATHPVAKKARALWISLHQLGAINDASERGLESFARRQLGVKRLQWADQSQGYRLIEALKAMAERHGWDQHVSSRMPAAQRVRVLKERLIGAQLARLAALGAPVAGPLAEDRAGWPDKRLESAAIELGARLHDAAPFNQS